jgi:hypothetical protein
MNPTVLMGKALQQCKQIIDSIRPVEPVGENDIPKGAPLGRKDRKVRKVPRKVNLYDSIEQVEQDQLHKALELSTIWYSGKTNNVDEGDQSDINETKSTPARCPDTSGTSSKRDASEDLQKTSKPTKKVGNSRKKTDMASVSMSSFYQRTEHIDPDDAESNEDIEELPEISTRDMVHPMRQSGVVSKVDKRNTNVSKGVLAIHTTFYNDAPAWKKYKASLMDTYTFRIGHYNGKNDTLIDTQKTRMKREEV